MPQQALLKIAILNKIIKNFLYLITILCLLYTSTTNADEIGFDEDKLDINLICKKDSSERLVGIKHYKQYHLANIKTKTTKKYAVPLSLATKLSVQGYDEVYTFFDLLENHPTAGSILWRSTIFIKGGKAVLSERWYKADKKIITDLRNSRKNFTNLAGDDFVKGIAEYTYKIMNYNNQIKDQEPVLFVQLDCKKN